MGSDELSFINFSVREFVFTIEIRSLLEVAETDPADIFIEGEGVFRRRVNFRGALIPILDMASLIGRPPRALDGNLQILVVEIRGNPMAFIIDGILEVTKERGIPFRLPALLRTENNRYIKGVLRYRDRISFLLDPLLTLNSDEIDALGN